MTTPPDDVMTVDQVAELLHLHPQTIYEKVANGEIPGSFRLGDGERAPLRFYRAHIMKWLERVAR